MNDFFFWMTNDEIIIEKKKKKKQKEIFKVSFFVFVLKFHDFYERKNKNPVNNKIYRC